MGAAGLAVVLSALAVGSCTPGDHPRAAPGGSGTSTSPAPSPRHVVEMDAEQVRSFELPTLVEFARQPDVVNVIRGKVAASRPLVSQPGNVVETILTVEVAEQRDEAGPRTVEVREQGGLVTVAQVRSDFEGKLGRELEPGELEAWADYRFNGMEHARVGEQVLIVVGSDPSGGESDYVGLARLRRAAGGAYEWPGRSPNPRWESSTAAESLLASPSPGA